MNHTITDPMMLRAILDAAHPTIIEDADGLIIAINQEAERVYGWSSADLLGRPFNSLVPPEQWGSLRSLRERCHNGEVLRNTAQRRITRDGQVLEVLVNLIPLRDRQGQLVGLASVATNVTELYRAQVQIEQLSRVFMDAADPIIIEDTEGIIQEVNQRALEVYEWPREALVGQPIKRLVPAEYKQHADELLRACLRGEPVRDVEGVRISRTGTRRAVLLTLSPLLDQQRRVIAVASIAKDITDLKNVQQELQQLTQELERRVQERTLALEALTHELERHKLSLKRELAIARALGDAAQEGHDISLLGQSPPISTLRLQIQQHAQIGQPLLLSGPRGVNAESVARDLHKRSGRAGAFIYVNCAQSSGGLTQILLGDKRADAADGKVFLAHKGTLYLEHVERLSHEAQRALLGFLREEREFPEISLIAFSSLNLQDTREATRLDEELWKALSERVIRVPSLLERREDLPLIVEALIERRARQLGKLIVGVEAASMARLQRYTWPGNFRELEGIIERLVLLTDAPVICVDEDALQLGRRVGSYHLEACIGRGGMGEVWRARHRLLQRPAAVKLIRAEHGDDEERHKALLKRFQREAHATAQLRSPHTVELYDFGAQDNGEFYYVMELLEGMDLEVLLQKHGPQPPARVAHILLQIAYSLQEAHERGLVHRDIKPGNIMLCVLGSSYDFVKVLDFGIVRVVEDDESRVTQTGTIAGTPDFLAPEIFQHQSEATATTDIYALGCLAWLLLTGEAPFHASSAMATLLAHITRPTPRLSALLPEIDPALDEIIYRCMAKLPQARPQEIAQLLPALQRVAAGWSVADARAWWGANAQEELSRLQHAPLSTSGRPASASRTPPLTPRSS